MIVNYANYSSRAKHRIVGDYDEQTKRVLLLGAGYVSAPVVEYLTRSNDIAVYVGNEFLKNIYIDHNGMLKVRLSLCQRLL